MTSLLLQELGVGASLELLGLMASGTNAVAGLSPGLPLAGLIQVCSLLGAQLLLLLHCPSGFILPVQMSDQESGL